MTDLNEKKKLSPKKWKKVFFVGFSVIAALPPLINGWFQIYVSLIDAMTYPINAVVMANYSPMPKEIVEKNGLSENENTTYVSLILRNDGSDTIKNVQFDFGTASFINVDYGRKSAPQIFKNQRFIPIRDILSHDKVYISMWTSLKENDLNGPEEITAAIEKDIHITHDGKPGRGKIISYYTDDGKSKFNEYRFTI